MDLFYNEAFIKKKRLTIPWFTTSLSVLLYHLNVGIQDGEAAPWAHNIPEVYDKKPRVPFKNIISLAISLDEPRTRDQKVHPFHPDLSESH